MLTRFERFLKKKTPEEIGIEMVTNYCKKNKISGSILGLYDLYGAVAIAIRQEVEKIKLKRQ